MKKIKKTYRLNQSTVEQIEVLKEHYASQGFGLSDANIIEKAVMSLMDAPMSRGIYTAHPGGGKSVRFFEKEGDKDA